MISMPETPTQAELKEKIGYWKVYQRAGINVRDERTVDAIMLERQRKIHERVT